MVVVVAEFYNHKNEFETAKQSRKTEPECFDTLQHYTYRIILLCTIYDYGYFLFFMNGNMG